MSFIGVVTTVGCDSVSFERQPYRKLIRFINLNYNSPSTCKDRQHLNQKKCHPWRLGLDSVVQQLCQAGRFWGTMYLDHIHVCMHCISWERTVSLGTAVTNNFALAYSPIGQFECWAHALISRPASRTGWTRVNLTGPKQEPVQLSYEWLLLSTLKIH